MITKTELQSYLPNMFLSQIPNKVLHDTRLWQQVMVGEKAAVCPLKQVQASQALSGSVAGSPVADSPDLKVPERGSSGLPTRAVASASVEHSTVKQADKQQQNFLHVAIMFVFFWILMWCLSYQLPLYLFSIKIFSVYNFLGIWLQRWCGRPNVND